MARTKALTLPVCRHSGKQPRGGVTGSFKMLIPFDLVLSVSQALTQTQSYSKCYLNDNAS